MALIAEVFRLHMTHMAVGAVQILAVMRRDVRIGWLDFFGLLHERILLMARRAGFNRRGLRVLRIGPVAHLAAQPLGLVTVGKEIVLSINGKGGG